MPDETTMHRKYMKVYQLIEKEKELQDEISSMRDQRKIIINSINANELSDLTFKEILYFQEKHWYMMNDNTKLIFKSVLAKKKIEEFPESKKAVYFPEINQLDFLTESEKVITDNFIHSYRTGNYIQDPNLLRKKGIHSYEKSKKILEALCHVDVLTKYYSFECECGDSSLFFSDDDLEPVRRGVDEIYIDCETGHCDGRIISNNDQIEKNWTCIAYRVIKPAQKAPWES